MLMESHACPHPGGGLLVRFPEDVPMFADLAGINLVLARLFNTTSFRSGGGGMVGNAGDMLTFFETVRRGAVQSSLRTLLPRR
jgi:hypothetical protein